MNWDSDKVTTLEDIPVTHARFQRKTLAVRTSSFLGPKLLADGTIVERQKGAYQVEDDGGRPARIQLKGGIDPIPKVVIDGDVVLLVRPLVWYEYAWAAWPLGLVAVGGALGGLCGGAAAVVNIRLLRSEQPAVVRYGVSALLGAVAVVVWLGFRSMLLRGMQ